MYERDFDLEGEANISWCYVCHVLARNDPTQSLNIHRAWLRL